ncbi:MAG: cytochrome c biogenesis protein CcdA [Gemmatimonadaceae bacterium]
MILILAFLGGILTIASPCILPVLPLVFSRAERSFTRETLPLLAGLAVSFAATAALATAAVGWLVVASEIGRYLALALLAVVAVGLLSSRVAEWSVRPLHALGARLDASARGRSGAAGNALIGAAIGLLWAPCAGPILGLVIASASAGSATRAAGLFLAFAAGAAISLAAVVVTGNRALAALRGVGGMDRYIRPVLGVATLATVLAIAMGWDAALFAKGGLVRTASAEETLVNALGRGKPAASDTFDRGVSIDLLPPVKAAPALPILDGMLPSFDGGTEWINSTSLTPASLRGKVVLVDFWTFACYNCLNALPHVKELYAKYKDRGLVVVGVHTPELAHERVVENVRREVARLGITYPVVIDNGNKIWNAFHNEYWPAAYYADATGKLRFYHFGEGKYEEQDQVVAKLLAEAGR